MITDPRERLVTIAEKELLISHGVDNWEGYAESISNYYRGSEDPAEDADEFLDALGLGGVDNWDGHSEAMRALVDYEEYVDWISDEDIDNALTVHQWLNQKSKAGDKSVVSNSDEDEVEEGNEEAFSYVSLRKSDQLLYSFIVGKFGGKRAVEVFNKVKEDGLVFRKDTFPSEFSQAMSVLKTKVNYLGEKSVDPMEDSRLHLLYLVLCNERLHDFMDYHYGHMQ